jgi:hypothetical protein
LPQTPNKSVAISLLKAGHSAEEALAAAGYHFTTQAGARSQASKLLRAAVTPPAAPSVGSPEWLEQEETDPDLIRIWNNALARDAAPTPPAPPEPPAAPVQVQTLEELGAIKYKAYLDLKADLAAQRAETEARFDHNTYLNCGLPEDHIRALQESAFSDQPVEAGIWDAENGFRSQSDLIEQAAQARLDADLQSQRDSDRIYSRGLKGIK